MQSPKTPSGIHPSYPESYAMSTHAYRLPRSRRSSSRSPRHRRVVGHSNKAASVPKKPGRIVGRLKPWKTKNSHVLKKPISYKPHQRPPPPPSPIRTKAIPKPNRTQAESTFKSVARWKKRLKDKNAYNQIHPSLRPRKKKQLEGTSKLTNEMILYLCDISGPMIRGFRRADEDMSGELSKAEFEGMVSYLNQCNSLNVSKQDADLLFLAFDDDNSGSITTHEMVNGLFNAHQKCPTNILGQRLMPRRTRENHNEKHQLSAPRSPRVDVFEPLRNQIPKEYEMMKPREPKIFGGRSAFQRRYDFLYGKDEREWVQNVRHHQEHEDFITESQVGYSDSRSNQRSRMSSTSNQSRHSNMSQILPNV